MKKLLVVCAFFAMSGCASIMEMIPSRWDANQSYIVTDIQQSVRHIDCKADLSPQLSSLFMKVEWYDLYATTKGTKDMAKLDQVVLTTIKEFQEKVATGSTSPMYCDLKKKILIQQADIIAKTVQGRF